MIDGLNGIRLNEFGGFAVYKTFVLFEEPTFFVR
jgi:hypothetical protein